MPSVELFGESFELHPDGVNPTALLFFAKDMRDATDGGDVAAQQATMLELCLDTIVTADRRRYRKVMMENRAGIDDHMKVIAAATEVAADRPTSLPSVSTDGPTSIAPRSETVYERAERLLPGRPHFQMALVRDLEREAG